MKASSINSAEVNRPKLPGLRKVAAVGLTALALTGCVAPRGDSAPETTAPETTSVVDTLPEVTTTESIETPEQSKVVGLLELNNKPSRAKEIYAGIDWESFDGIAESAPAPMEVVTKPGKLANAQDIVDAWSFNHAMMFLTRDSAYQEAMYSKWPETTYDKGINDYWENVIEPRLFSNTGNYWNITGWGKALGIERGENLDEYIITGQQVSYEQTSFWTRDSIYWFEMTVHASRQDDGTIKWLVDEASYDYDNPILERINELGDTAFSLWIFGKAIPLELPYVEKNYQG